MKDPTDEELHAKAEYAAKLQRRRRYREAAEMYHEVMLAYKPETPYLVLRCAWGTAGCWYRMGRIEDALDAMRKTMPVWEEKLNLAHPTSIMALSFFTKLLLQQQAWDEFMPWQHRLITAVSSYYGRDSRKYIGAVACLGVGLGRAGADAEDLRANTAEFRASIQRCILKWLRPWRKPWRKLGPRQKAAGREGNVTHEVGGEM